MPPSYIFMRYTSIKKSQVLLYYFCLASPVQMTQDKFHQDHWYDNLEWGYQKLECTFDILTHNRQN